MTNPHKVGMVIGALIGGWHFVWSLPVGIGFDLRFDQIEGEWKAEIKL